MNMSQNRHDARAYSWECINSMHLLGAKMVGLIVGLIAGLLVIFVVPPFTPDQYRGWLSATTARIIGIVIILFAIASTSYVQVPAGYSAHLSRLYGGGSLPNGRIIAANGENGRQARILPPGLHVEPLINIAYEVNTSFSDIYIPEGKVGILTAHDGVALRSGQAFADPFPKGEEDKMVKDAEFFLKNGGQRGPQLSVLQPGTHRINRYLWDVEIAEAYVVPAGFVGVVKSNVHASIDLETLKAQKPDVCERITLSNEVDSQHIDAPVVPVGCIGVWDKALQPGKYYINPKAFTITNVNTLTQKWKYAGGYTHAQIILTSDAKGDIVQTRTEEDVPEDSNNADRAIMVKMEGWDVPIELQITAQVTPNDAACVVAGVGTLEQVEDRIITPAIRTIARDVAGGTYEVTEPKTDANGKPILDKDGKEIIVRISRPTKVLDLINQRALINDEMERRIRLEARNACVTIHNVQLEHAAIPPELTVARRWEKLATELTNAFIQQQNAQTQRVASEKAKATADQQAELVQAEIEVQRSAQLSEAARNTGIGERDKLAAMAEGQKKQMEVLGLDATVKLRQLELVLQFAEKHPDVIASMFNNAHKFVPQITVGQGDGASGLLTALIGDVLSRQEQPKTASQR